MPIITCVQHDMVSTVAQTINPDTIIVIRDMNETTPCPVHSNTATIHQFFFDDVDLFDLDCGTPFSSKDAIKIKNIIQNSHVCIVTCAGGVSRSAAIAAAAHIAKIATCTHDPFKRNAANRFVCPNRFIFNTCINAWNTPINTEEIDALFNKNIIEHNLANV